MSQAEAYVYVNYLIKACNCVIALTTEDEHVSGIRRREEDHGSICEAESSFGGTAIQAVFEFKKVVSGTP